MTANAAGLDDWLVRFVGSASSDRQVDRFVDIVDGEILRQIPQIAADPVLVDELHRSTRFQWLGFLSAVTEPGYRHTLPAPAAALARSLARRGLELGVLLKVYRAAHLGVFEYFDGVIEGLGEGDPPAAEILRILWRDSDAWIDDSVEKLIETFYTEHRSVLEGAIARRGRTIQGLLDGTSTDIDAASAALGHNLRLPQSALVIWSAGEGEADDLPAAAAAIARCLGAGDQLTHRAGSRDLWCWVATRVAPDPGAWASVAEPATEFGVRVAAGTTAGGVDGFRDGHLEAVAVRALCAGAPGTTGPVFRYAEVDLLCIAAGRPDLLRRLVSREVGPIGAADRNMATLRETALAYLVRRMNVEATARALFVHANTVRYRINRVEELLGHPLTERSAHVELALRYLELFGPVPSSG